MERPRDASPALLDGYLWTKAATFGFTSLSKSS